MMSMDDHLTSKLASNSVTPKMQTVTLNMIIERVSTRQPILNIDNIDTSDLQAYSGMSSLSQAGQDKISFLADDTYAQDLKVTQAGVVFVNESYAETVPEHTLAVVVNSPYLAYASTSQLFDKYVSLSKQHTLIHPHTQIAESAQIGNNVSIGAYSVVEENVIIGDNTVIESQVHIGEGTLIGSQCTLHSQVNIEHHCVIGDNVRIHSHASIGSEGFGFAPTADPATTGWERIVQLGRVVIGNNVRIGSQTCIDRGAIEDTVIGDNVIIDNLVQIAHNVNIGAGTAIAAKTGIAGSTHIGKRCIIGGAVGISGHLNITDDVTLSGMTMVTKSIKKSGAYSSGTAAMPTDQWRRAAVRFRNMGKK